MGGLSNYANRNFQTSQPKLVSGALEFATFLNLPASLSIDLWHSTATSLCPFYVYFIRDNQAMK
jgi:hypothetical protein